MEVGTEKMDDQQQVEIIANLMGLYSTAIEFYNREKDEDNQNYYVDKLQKLNETIRELVERQQRLQSKINQNARETTPEKNEPIIQQKPTPAKETPQK